MTTKRLINRVATAIVYVMMCLGVAMAVGMAGRAAVNAMREGFHGPIIALIVIVVFCASLVIAALTDERCK